MAKPTYDKPPVTISEQLDILEEKGMVITDIKKLLQPIIPNDTLELDLASLFAKYPFADKRKNTYLGFPDDWHSDKGVW